MMTTQLRAELDVDLWSDDGIAHRYSIYRALRQLPGPVWLPRHGLYVLSRYADVRAALEDWRTYSSAHGAMMNAQLNELSSGVMLCSDPPRHDALRKVAAKPLHPSDLRQVEATVLAEADAVVERLVTQGTFDAAQDLATHLPVTVVTKLVGLPVHLRDRMLPWAEALFNCFGPANSRTEAAFPLVAEAFSASLQSDFRAQLEPGGWAARLFDAVDSGEISHADAVSLVNDYWAPSLDTTILATTSAIRLFGEHPDQWKLVRENPKLLLHAINEVVRLESPIQGFSRLLTTDHTVDGVTMPAGSRVVVLYGSANRDERKWADPDRFDVLRKPTDHVGFGAGEHRCMGLPLATMEMRAVLAALAKRVQRIELGDSTPLVNNVLHGLRSLMVTVH